MKWKDMTDSQKTTATNVGLRMAELNADDFGAEIVWRMMELIHRKGDNVTLKEVAEVTTPIRDKADAFYKAKADDDVKSRVDSLEGGHTEMYERINRAFKKLEEQGIAVEPIGEEGGGHGND